MNMLLRISYLVLGLLPGLLNSGSSQGHAAGYASGEQEVIKVSIMAEGLNTLEQAEELQRLLGQDADRITEVVVILESGEINITYLNDGMSVQDLLEIIAKTGYTARYKNEAGMVYEMGSDRILRTSYTKKQP